MGTIKAIYKNLEIEEYFKSHDPLERMKGIDVLRNKLRVFYEKIEKMSPEELENLKKHTGIKINQNQEDQTEVN